MCISWKTPMSWLESMQCVFNREHGVDNYIRYIYSIVNLSILVDVSDGAFTDSSDSLFLVGKVALLILITPGYMLLRIKTLYKTISAP